MNKKIIIAIFILTCVYFLYLYGENNLKNICLSVTTALSIDSVYMEVYWDDKKIDKKIYKPYGFDFYRFNVFPGKHTVRIKGEDFEEEFSFFIFPLKHIDLEYCGPDTYFYERDSSLFIVRKSFAPLMFE